MKKTNTLVSISHPVFQVKLGSFGKKDPTVIFFEGTAYITPKKDMDYECLYRDISDSFSKSVKRMISSTRMFSSPFISLVEFPYERMKVGKKTYMTIECHLMQKKAVDLISLSERKDEFITSVIDGLIEEAEDMGAEITKGK